MAYNFWQTCPGLVLSIVLCGLLYGIGEAFYRLAVSVFASVGGSSWEWSTVAATVNAVVAVGALAGACSREMGKMIRMLAPERYEQETRSVPGDCNLCLALALCCRVRLCSLAGPRRSLWVSAVCAFCSAYFPQQALLSLIGGAFSWGVVWVGLHTAVTDACPAPVLGATIALLSVAGELATSASLLIIPVLPLHLQLPMLAGSVAALLLFVAYIRLPVPLAVSHDHKEQ
jgi:hypothetical protein